MLMSEIYEKLIKGIVIIAKGEYINIDVNIPTFTRIRTINDKVVFYQKNHIIMTMPLKTYNEILAAADTIDKKK